MRWRKLGVVVPGDPPLSFARSHAMVPVLLPLGGDGCRIYFSARDADGRARIAWGELDFPNGRISYFDRPALDLGALGAFDDSGVMTGSLVRDGDEVRLYYIGWSRGVTVPFYTFVGLAVSTDGGRTFERASASPLLERTPDDPFLTTSPFVLRDGDRWRMWYVAGTAWRLVDSQPRHWYHIRGAESDDGLVWRRDGVPQIDYGSPDEYAIARPCVVHDADVYRMWYSHRGDAYRIGYATSADGSIWERRDREAGIEPSETGWDSQMIEYPYVFDHGGARYMLYNGNGYGASGVGAAILEDAE